MAKPTTLSLDQRIDALTIGDLLVMITEIVRKVVREEISKDYYINENGIKVLYEQEDIAPEYLAQLNRDYEDIESGDMELIAGEMVLEELKELGLNVCCAGMSSPPVARQKLKKLARRSPKFAEAIVRKIVWLTENAGEIAHRPIKGSEFYSLHSGSYRIPYLLDKSKKLIIIDDTAKHDAPYDRIGKL